MKPVKNPNNKKDKKKNKINMINNNNSFTISNNINKCVNYKCFIINKPQCFKLPTKTLHTLCNKKIFQIYLLEELTKTKLNKTDKKNNPEEVEKAIK